MNDRVGKLLGAAEDFNKLISLGQSKEPGAATQLAFSAMSANGPQNSFENQKTNFPNAMGKLKIVGDKFASDGPVGKIVANYLNAQASAGKAASVKINISIDVNSNSPRVAAWNVQSVPSALKMPIIKALDALYQAFFKKTLQQNVKDNSVPLGHAIANTNDFGLYDADI